MLLEALRCSSRYTSDCREHLLLDGARTRFQHFDELHDDRIRIPLKYLLLTILHKVEEGRCCVDLDSRSAIVNCQMEQLGYYQFVESLLYHWLVVVGNLADAICCCMANLGVWVFEELAHLRHGKIFQLNHLCHLAERHQTRTSHLPVLLTHAIADHREDNRLELPTTDRQCKPVHSKVGVFVVPVLAAFCLVILENPLRVVRHFHHQLHAEEDCVLEELRVLSSHDLLVFCDSHQNF
mmetsp:Transcript_11224/g.17928  ORF Transcript_11224/g.17928 Transcript_11224/m.17928 type:complete len:238 (-) Transcript_11224:321-1034(-)